jgi:two-component system response regulator AtoC
MTDLIPDLPDDMTCSAEQVPYLRLLWEHELAELHSLLTAIAERCDDIIAHWHELCARQLGDSRRLPQAEFSAIFSPYLRQSTRALLDNDLARYTMSIRYLSEQLAGHEVPFTEITLSFHLCKQSISTICSDELSPERYKLLDKLTQLRTALLAEGYFRAQPANARPAPQMPHDQRVGLPQGEPRSFHGLVGASPAMRLVYERIEAAAKTRGTVLIVGESGTGKELVARAIHNAGPRAGASFVAVNCPAIPKDLIESELFGHRRGAFSGANFDYLGLFRAADGGTLLLDEVTEMNLETQSKLLRVLQERSVRPVGSTSEIPVDVRLVASTNRRPDEAVRMGLLRQDLYYRLQAGVIEVPALRERREDIPLLVNHFIRLFNTKAVRSAPVTGINADAMARLLRYSWPGNVRELSNAIESAITFGRGERIGLDDLPSAIRQNEPVIVVREADSQPEEGASSLVRSQASSAPKTFAESERELIVRTLRITGNNKTYAAELLRISRKKLYARLAKYGLLAENRRTRHESAASLPLAAALG